MKKLFFCIAMLSFLASDAQERMQPLGTPKSSLLIRGGVVVDSVFVLPRFVPSTLTLKTGALRYQISDSSLYSWTGSQWLKQAGGGGGGTANLGKTLTANDITITNSNGTAVTIPASDGTNAGLVTADRFNTWNNKLSAANISVVPGTSSVAINSSAGSGGSVGAVDATHAGVVTPSMKTTWDGKISTVSVVNSIQGNGNNTALQLKGDVASPGASKYYGTSAGSVFGWWPVPGGGGGSADIINITASDLDASGTLATDKLYFITDDLKWGFFKYFGTAANQAADNGGTVIINSALQEFHRLYDGDIDARWFGCVADGTSQASPGGGDARNLIKALAAATTRQRVLLPMYNGLRYYIDTTVTLAGSSKVYNLYIDGNLYGYQGTNFIVDGPRHQFYQKHTFTGPNTVAGTDSASFAARTNSTAVFVRNCDKCDIESGVVSEFKYGIRVGGQSDSVHLGTQYSDIKIKQAFHNYIELWLTIDGTTTDGGSNWCNSNRFYCDQLGSGVSANLGGGFAIKMEKIGGNSVSKFETNSFYTTGFEGNVYGLYAEFAKNNNWIDGRIEDGAITNKIYFRQDNTGGLSATDNKMFGFYLYERYFIAGGIGDGTELIGCTLYTQSSSIAGFMGVAFGGKFTYFTHNDAATAFNESVGDIVAFNNLDGNAPDRYMIKARIGGKILYVPYEAGDTVYTGAGMTVPNRINNVYVNRPSGVSTITLPPPSQWDLRPIAIRNLEVTQSVTVAGTVRPGDRTTVPPGQTIQYQSVAGEWVDVSYGGAGGGGGGTFSLGTFGSTPNAAGASYNSGTGVYNNQPADSTHPGMVSTGNQIWQGGKQMDSIATDAFTLFKTGSGWLKTNIIHRQNGFSVNDNSTPNAASTALTAYNFGSGSSSRDIMVGVGKTGVNFAGFGNDGTDFIQFTEKTTGGFEFRKGVGYASATLQSGTPLMKIFGSSGDVTIGGTMVDSAFKLDVKGSLRTLGPVNMRDLTGADTRMVVVTADGTLDAQTIPAGGGGGSSIFTAGAGTGSPYYHSTGPVNIGINPTQSFAWTHWGASTSTRAIWEFASTSIAPSAPRNHQVYYDGAAGELHLYSNNTDQVFLTSTTYAPFTGFYQGSPIGLGYLDAGSSTDKSPIVSDGSGGAKVVKPPFTLEYSNASSTPVGASTTSAVQVIGGAKTLQQTALQVGDGVEMEGSLEVTVGGSTTTLNLNFVFGGYTRSVPVSVPVGNIYNIKFKWRISPTATGTSVAGFSELSIKVQQDFPGNSILLDNVFNDIPTTLNTTSPSINLTSSFSASNASNNVYPRVITVKTIRQ
jgi:hypothetical protein